MYSNCLLEERHLISKDWNFVSNENYLFGGESTPETRTSMLHTISQRSRDTRSDSTCVVSHGSYEISVKSKKENIDDVSKFVNDFYHCK